MRAHYLQHVSFEGLGSIEAWLDASGYETTCTRFFDAVNLPNLKTIDLIIVLGGPMSVNDEGEFPWLAQEKQFIREAIQAGKSVLGICLGAQLIASAMGARVSRNTLKEIGWFPVQGLQSIDSTAFRFPHSVDVFHWHGETFDLPESAIQLARSEGCENQAFQLGKSVIGMQFHLESTPETVLEIVEHCEAELLPSKYVQSKTAILSASLQNFTTINILMNQVLSFLKRN